MLSVGPPAWEGALPPARWTSVSGQEGDRGLPRVSYVKWAVGPTGSGWGRGRQLGGRGNSRLGWTQQVHQGPHIPTVPLTSVTPTLPGCKLEKGRISKASGETLDVKCRSVGSRVFMPRARLSPECHWPWWARGGDGFPRIPGGTRGFWGLGRWREGLYSVVVLTTSHSAVRGPLHAPV